MKHFRMYILAAVACWGLPSVAEAQRTMTLGECLKTALEHNLDLKAGEMEVDKAVMLQKTAFDPDKISLSISQDPTAGGSTDNSWSVTQDFSFPTVYTARSRALKSETGLRRKELEVVRHDVIKEVTAAYYTLLYNRDVMRIYEEQDTIYRKFLELATKKFKLGEAGRLEKMNAERLYSENKLTWHQVEKDFHEAQLTLQRRMGINDEVAPADSAFTAIPVLAAGDDFDFGETPWAGVLEQQQKLTENNLLVEKRGFLPDFSISLRSQLVLKAFNPYNVDRSLFDKGNFMGFEVGVSFPLFFGARKARVKAAKQEVLLAGIKAQQTERRLHNQYRQALNEYIRARKDLDYYVKKGNPEADKMLGISRISYEKGEIGYVEYIQNLQTVADIHLRYARALNTYNQSVILLNYLQGK